MTLEEIDAQMERSYGDRMPGYDSRRQYDVLDELPPITARPPRPSPPKTGRCRVCGVRIVGRPTHASSCVVHNLFSGPPDREGLLALLEEHQAVVRQVRAELRRMDKEADE